jgi:prepilin-type N-terminal cleavage/methylation domain-containing protein
MGSPSKQRLFGFTLVEILVALAIMATLAAVLFPSLSGKIRDSRTAALMQSFQSFAQGIAEFKKGTTRYPGSLTLLTIAPTASSLDICGNVMSTTPSSLWRGPYMNRTMLSTGLPMGDAIIEPGLRRVVSGTEIYIMIDAAGVESGTAGDLEAQLDASIDYTTGTIRAQTGGISATTTSGAIAAAPTGTYNLSYAVPIQGC